MRTIINEPCRRCGTGRLVIDRDPITGSPDSVCLSCGCRRDVLLVVVERPSPSEGGPCGACERRRLAAIRDSLATPEGLRVAKARSLRLKTWWKLHPEQAEARRELLRNRPRGPGGKFLPAG